MTVADDAPARYTSFFEDAEPRLRRAFTALRGRVDGLDATAEALAWAWEHWEEVEAMANPVGYLYRVGTSRSRPRTETVGLDDGRLTDVGPHGVGDSDFEPGLTAALARLSERQRTIVVLVHGCGWTYQEVAAALDLAKPTVGTHVRRALEQLRTELGATDER